MHRSSMYRSIDIIGVMPLPAASSTIRLCLLSSKQNFPYGREACNANPGCTMSLRNAEAVRRSARLHVISTYLLCVVDELMEYERTTRVPPTISLKVRN